jgi:hypothetical protein
MATTNEENWIMRYNEPKTYVAMYYHFPDKYKVEFRGLLNWAKYTEEKQGWCFAREAKTHL